MRFPKKIVEIAVSLYHKGLTLKNAAKIILEIFGYRVSTTSIWKWCQKFIKKPSGIINGLAERLHADETLLRTFQKGIFLYLWALKDPATRTIVGWHISEKRDLQNAKLLFWEARRHFPPIYFPKRIRTDKMPAYPFAIAKVFNHEVKRDRVISFKHGNNVIENFWRCKRTFPRFRKIESARNYVGHWVAEYNSEKMQILEMFIIL